MVPPGLLMRTMRALMSLSPSAFCSSSRTRATIGTLGGGAVSARLALSSESTPETSMRRILALPLPSTVSSWRRRMRGTSSILRRDEQP